MYLFLHCKLNAIVQYFIEINFVTETIQMSQLLEISKSNCQISTTGIHPINVSLFACYNVGINI